MVRLFAEYRSATDPRTEVPPKKLLSGLRAQTYCTLFGLLSVTGMRISEALALNREDIDPKQAVLTIRGTKFGKTRLVPYTNPPSKHYGNMHISGTASIQDRRLVAS